MFWYWKRYNLYAHLLILIENMLKSVFFNLHVMSSDIYKCNLVLLCQTKTNQLKNMMCIQLKFKIWQSTISLHTVCIQNMYL
jgi:hypothetical protein